MSGIDASAAIRHGLVPDRDRAQAVADLQRRRFHSPAAIGTYCALFPPLGLYLYALNLVQRRERASGFTLAILSGVMFLGAIPGNGFSIFVGMGVFALESGTFRWALAHGGRKARWWPPLLWFLGLSIVLRLVEAFTISRASAP
jgi:hypothetical protein